MPVIASSRSIDRRVAVRQIVEAHDLVSRRCKRSGDMAADIARSARQ